MKLYQTGSGCIAITVVYTYYSVDNFFQVHETSVCYRENENSERISARCRRLQC